MMRCEITHTGSNGAPMRTVFECDEATAIERVLVFRNTETLKSITIPIDRVVFVESEEIK